MRCLVFHSKLWKLSSTCIFCLPNIGQIKEAIWNHLFFKLAQFGWSGNGIWQRKRSEPWVGDAHHKPHRALGKPEAKVFTEAPQPYSWSHRQDSSWIKEQRPNPVMIQSLWFLSRESCFPQPHQTSRFSIQQSSGQEEVLGPSLKWCLHSNPGLSHHCVCTECLRPAPALLFCVSVCSQALHTALMLPYPVLSSQTRHLTGANATQLRTPCVWLLLHHTRMYTIIYGFSLDSWPMVVSFYLIFTMPCLEVSERWDKMTAKDEWGNNVPCISNVICSFLIPTESSLK